MNVCALIEPKSVTPGRSNVIFISYHASFCETPAKTAPAGILLLARQKVN
jgi:hypothetical protein